MPASGSFGRRLAAILIGAALLRLVHGDGFVGMDDGLYARDAARLARHGPAVPTFFSACRLGLIAPAAVLFRWFGISDVTTALWPFLASLGSALLAALLGRARLGERAGLVAALLVAAAPLEVSYASYLYPAVPGGFFGALAAAFVLVPRAAGRRRATFDLLGGVALGLAWMTSEQSLIAAAFLLPWTLFGRERAGRLALAGGALLVFAGECLAYRLATGDAFYRLHIATRTYLDYIPPDRFAGDLADRLLLAWPRVVLFPWTDGFLETGPGFAIALAAAVLLIVGRRWRPAAPFLLWGGLGFGYLVAAAVRAPGLVPLMPVPSYLVPLVVPAALVAASAFAGLRAGAVPLALWLLTGATLPALSPLGDDSRTADRAARQLARNPPCPLHALTHTATIVAYRFGFPEDGCVREIGPAGPALQSLAGFVLVDRERLRHLRPRLPASAASDLAAGRSGWSEIARWEERPRLRARLRAALGLGAAVVREPTILYRIDRPERAR